MFATWRVLASLARTRDRPYYNIHVPSRYLNSGYPRNRGIFPKAAHARTINAMMHFLGFPERVVAHDRRHKYEASGCGSHK